MLGKSHVDRRDLINFSPTSQRDKLPDREISHTLKEVQVLTEQHNHTYTRIRPHSSLSYRPPAPETMMTAEPVPELAGLT